MTRKHYNGSGFDRLARSKYVVMPRLRLLGLPSGREKEDTEMSELSQFQGKESGDIFDFIQSFHGCTFGEAIEMSLKILGQETSILPHPCTAEPQK
jgi:hypothetical protein